MADFASVLRSGRLLLMDGAVGTELQRAGLPEGHCGELWNLHRPEVLQTIHASYAAAGAEVLLTNTFQANPAVLARHGAADQLVPVLRAGVELARQAAGPGRWVLASFGPQQTCTDDLVAMLGAVQSADGIVVETQSSVALLHAIEKAGTIAWPAIRRLPVLISFTFLRSPQGELQTHSGLTPETAARLVSGVAGVAAFGVNCGREIGLEDTATIVRRYRTATNLPLFARPNAGTPTRTSLGWSYPLTPEAIAAYLPALRSAGATMVGGCCGTTPEHIAAFRAGIALYPASRA